MADSATFNQAAEKIGRFLPAGAYTGFQYIAAQITTDGVCDETQVHKNRVIHLCSVEVPKLTPSYKLDLT